MKNLNYLFKLIIFICLNIINLSLCFSQANDNNNNSSNQSPNKYVQEYNFTSKPKSKPKIYKPVNSAKTNKAVSARRHDNKSVLTGDLEVALSGDLIKNLDNTSHVDITKDIPKNCESFDDLLKNNKMPSNELLQNGIIHSDRLSTIQMNTNTKDIFDEEKVLNQLPKSRNWFQIPNWLAGDWHRDWELILNSTDRFDTSINRKFLSETEVSYGTQFDKNNDVWELKSLPSFGEINANNYSQYMTKAIITKEEYGDYKNPNYTVKANAITFEINKFTRQIIDIKQYEEIGIMNLIKPGIIRTISSVKWFSKDGMPLYQDQRVEFIFLTKIFSPINKDNNGDDLKADFIRYLKNHNLNNLVPN